MSELPLTKLVKEVFDDVDLHEDDVLSYERYYHSTSEFDVSSNTGSYEVNANYSGSDLIPTLKDGELMLCWKYTKSDGTDLPALAYDAGTAGTHMPAGAVTLGAGALVKNFRVEINAEPFDEAIDIGQIMNVLIKSRYSKEWVDSNKHKLHYFPALVAGDTTDTYLIEAVQNIRTVARANGWYWSFIPLSLFLGSANMEKVFPNTNFTFRALKQNDLGSILYRAGAGAYNGEVALDADLGIKIKHFRISLKCLKVKDRLLNDYMSKAILSDKAIPLDWLKIGHVKLSVNATANNLNVIPLFSGVRKPRHIFCAIEPEAVLATQSAGNPSVYTSGGVTEFYIQLNGRQYPFNRLTPEAYNYQDALSALGDAFEMEGNAPLVNQKNFKSLHQIYYFDVSKTDSIFEENGTAPLVQLNFTTTNSAVFAIQCVFLSEQHHVLKAVGHSMRVSAVANN